MCKVNWCWACNFCGEEKEFKTVKEAVNFANKISPYASCLFVGEMPDGVGVINYPNARCEYLRQVGNYSLARKIKALMCQLKEGVLIC